MTRETELSLKELSVKTVLTHTVTYFIMGMIAQGLIGYADRLASPEFACWMRSTDDTITMVGPFIQILRGMIFALVFFPLKEILFGRKNGWLVMFWMLVGIGILNPFAPPPGSIEGFIYTKIPILTQLSGWIEVVPQAFLLSFVLTYWVNNPGKRWIGIVMWVLFGLIMVMMTMALLALAVG